MDSIRKEQAKLNIELYLSCKKNDFLKVGLLIEKGADVNVKLPLFRENRLKNGFITPLIQSVLEGNYKMVQLLLLKNANPELRDHTGRTPLMYACGKGDILITEALHKYGADINAKNESQWSSLIHDWSVLSWGIYSNMPKITSFLIKNKVEVDDRTYRYCKMKYENECKENKNIKLIYTLLNEYVAKHPIKKK